MNKLDTGLVRGCLTAAGIDLTERTGEADIVIINTCSVRDHAEQRVWSHLGHLQHVKALRPHMVVAVIGCMAQRLGGQLLAHPAVDVVCGPMQLAQVVSLCLDALSNKSRSISVTSDWRRHAGPSAEGLEQIESAQPTQEGPGQAFVRVMRGCNRRCAYCIVPAVRGPEHSRPPAAIVEQVRRLADRGVVQVTLLGQTVNAYRYRAGERTFLLADLLEMVSQTKEIEWIRFVTSYPTAQHLGSILQVMATNPKICPYLHMPAQSGSDRILRAMGRGYTAAEYLELLEMARSRVPGIAVAGDFIVGFPGEEEQDFQASLELLEAARYKNCFVFKYSPRPNTPAFRMQDSVPMSVKTRRNHQMLAAQQRISHQWAQGLVGQLVTVLAEGPSKRAARSADGAGLVQLVGRTATDWPVVFDGPTSLAGTFVQVKIERASPFTLFGGLARV